MFIWIISIIFVFVGIQTAVSQKCADIDTAACELMAVQRPDLCKDPVVAKSACPDFCKLCPLECYQCSFSADDTQHCNTTVMCGVGEVCMTKELVSFGDGHREYQMSCEPPQHCDGTALSLSFGRRGLGPRDVSVTCCGSNLCNTIEGGTTQPISTTTLPPTTTATACRKDVIVIVDDTRRGFFSGIGVKQFLRDLTSGLPIGPNNVLMSVAKFTNSTTTLWDLTTHTDKASLENAIARANFMWHASSSSVDLDIALSYLLSLRYKSSSENRPNVDDVVIIITSHGAQSAVRDHLLASQLKSQYSNIITIGMTDHVQTDDLQAVATDIGHEFIIPGSRSLDSISRNVLSLIC